MVSEVAPCHPNEFAMNEKQSELRLDSLREEDSDALFQWINNPDLVNLSAPFQPITRDAHNEWFEGIEKRKNSRIFAIRKDGLVGTIQLIDIHPIHRSAELTIRLGPENLGMGLGTLALRALFDLARDEMRLHRVWLRVFSDNTRAIRSYDKVGMKKEGLMKEAAYIDGVWKDIVVMAIILAD